MRALILVTMLFFNTFLFSQNTDKDFNNAYDRIHSQKFFALNPTDPLEYSRDSMEVVEIHQLLGTLKEYMDGEHDLHGKAGFSFNGNESDLSSLFKIGANASMSKGAYPYEFDFSINVQTTIQDGAFQENLSDIDVSFDFHPYIPDASAEKDGLWLENFVFLKRFNNNFLGIEQRYETGMGFIFNFYSHKKLTASGTSNASALAKIPKYEVYGDDLVRCLNECYVKNSVMGITEAESKIISNTRERYRRSNVKQYAKFRTGMLVGLYYELEQSLARNIVNFNGMDTLLERSFDATNKLRLEVRPILSWQPKDRYRLKIYPYFKLPIGTPNSVVSQGNLRDVRYDWFLDMVSSFDIKLEENFTISFQYRLFYDNAPKRAYIEQEDGSYTLLVGQKRHSNFGVAFGFGF
ncbi:MAG: hypothetical protein R2879_19110 [Saprospiraceae bacterium]